MPDKYVHDGDVGSGRPGTPDWHRVQVAQMSDPEIVEYLKEAFDMTVTEIALEIIDANSN